MSKKETARPSELTAPPGPPPVTPANSRERLRAARVATYDKKKIHLPVCQACSCPGYSFELCYQVRKTAQARARELGFRFKKRLQAELAGEL